MAQNVTAQGASAAETQDEVSLPSPTEGEIIVIANALRGRIDAPQPPLLELDTEEIASYGAGSIAELISALGPQTGSSRGRGGGFPVILVNGTRVSSFRELRSYPPEAIERIEVFPEEVAQRYGYSADQRLVNFILKDNYQSREIQAEYGQPFDGGYSTKEVEGTYVRIAGPSRFNVNVGWSDSSLLTEGEREVIQSPENVPDIAGDPDPADYRSLVSDSSALTATGNWTTRLADNGSSLTLNTTVERSDSERLQGLDTVLLTDPSGNSALRSLNAENPLLVNTRSSTYALGGAINAPLGEFQLTGTVDANRAETRSRTRRRADTSDLVAAAAAGSLAIDADLSGLLDAGFDEANTTTDRVNSKLTAIGRPVLLPAGELAMTLSGGYDWTRIESEDTRQPGLQTQLKRGDLNAGINLGVPIASIREDHWAAIGDLSLNLRAGIDHLSDFGTLTDWSAGLTWSPTETLTFNASYISREAAPSLSQLGNPEIATPNVPVFDIERGETVQATIVTGGNPTLPAQSQGDWKVGLVWQLPFLERSNISVDYYKSRSENVASSFPILTPAIEAAFPGRITRDASGQLLSIDQRPISLAEQKDQRIQVGLNLSGPFGASQPQEEGGSDSGPGSSGGFARGGGGFTPPGAGAPGGFDPEQFRAMRERFCTRDADGNLPPFDLSAEAVAQLPEPMQQRLRGPDGEIDAAAAEEMRTRMCNMDEAPRGSGAGDSRAGGPGGPGGFSGPRGPGGRGPGGPGGGGDGRGRWFANLSYTYQISNDVLIAPGIPALDLLGGDALSGEQPRHAASVSGGLFYRGFGGRVSGSYTGSSRINGSGLPGSSDLTFHDYVTVNLRVFADLNQQTSLIEDVPLLENTRISLAVDNLFDARQRVTDQAGVVPLRYQPFLIDPVGRFFKVELRKLF